MIARRRFRHAPESVAAARRFIRQALRDHPREIADAAELLTSELATNSVRHAQTGFELTISLQGQIRVEVRDTGQGKPTVLSPGPQDPSGRGLRILEAIADTWGIIPAPEGKTVWFELPQAAALHERSAPAASDRMPPRGTQPGQTGSGPQVPHTLKRARKTPKALALHGSYSSAHRLERHGRRRCLTK